MKAKPFLKIHSINFAALYLQSVEIPEIHPHPKHTHKLAKLNP